MVKLPTARLGEAISDMGDGFIHSRRIKRIRIDIFREHDVGVDVWVDVEVSKLEHLDITTFYEIA